MPPVGGLIISAALTCGSYGGSLHAVCLNGVAGANCSSSDSGCRAGWEVGRDYSGNPCTACAQGYAFHACYECRWYPTDNCPGPNCLRPEYCSTYCGGLEYTGSTARVGCHTCGTNPGGDWGCSCPDNQVWNITQQKCGE